MAHGAAGREQDIVLKGGLVVDGAGTSPYVGNLLIRSGRIERISPRTLRTTGIVIDCADKIVAPGFIDAHSHLDWQIPVKGHDELKYPFLAQGITTVVAGNCGASAAGFREHSDWKQQAESNLLRNGLLKIEWDSVRDYFARIAAAGASHNLALLVGHGSTRASIRGNVPSPLHPYEMKELLWLLESSMDQGARGVSLGLQSEPGLFARADEIKEVALLVKRKGKILSVHVRAFSAHAPGFPLRAFGEAHNVAALREILDLARQTGVRLQVSHLVFVGSRTWRTLDTVLALIDKAIADGVDVRFDAYPSHCGQAAISLLLSPWFLTKGPAAYEDASSLRRQKREIQKVERLTGFGPSDIQVTDSLDSDRADYNGKFLHEIARIRRMSPVDALMDISRRSRGKARILCHKHSNDRIVETLMKHPAALFMTDAWVELAGVQNPSAFGAFPRLLQIARDRRLLPVEEAVRKMTGATAERFGLTGRGLLKEGCPADVTVFDWENVRDNTTVDKTNLAPSGIDYVFVNGQKIIGAGKKEHPLNAGVPLP